MNKMKIKYGFILFLLIMVGFNTSLPAKGNNLKLFLNLSTGTFEAFAFGVGADLKLHKSFSLRSSVDMPTTGGRIFNIDGVITFNTAKRLRPFFTVGYFDYYFEGNDRHDQDEVKSFAFGLGIEFYPKKDKGGASVGIKVLNSEGSSFLLLYCNFVIFKF